MNYKTFRFFLLTFIILNSSQIFSQGFTISGYVTDVKTGEVIIGAYIFCPQTGSGVVSNNAGFYALNIPFGTKNLMYLHEDYYAIIDTLKINRNKIENVYMKPMGEDDMQINPFDNVKQNIELGDANDTNQIQRITIKNSAAVNEIIAKALNRNIKIIDQMENGFVHIPGNQMNNMPALVGEIDVARSLKFVPGVAPGTELNNGMYVRGGSHDQNLVLMDGVPIYNTNHLFGFYSVFNSEGINSVQITKSGFSARNGGRLSGITDVTMKEGNPNQIHGIFLRSLMALTLDINGPLTPDGNTTFAISAKRSHWDLFLRPAGDENNKFWYTFYDLNAKVCHKINDKNKLFFSTYSGRDRLYISGRESGTDSFGNQINNDNVFELKWGNFISSVRLNSVINERLFANFSLNYSEYKSFFGIGFGQEIDSFGSIDKASVDFSYRNHIKDYNVKADFDYIMAPKHTLRFGVSNSVRTFLPGSTKVKYVRNSIVEYDSTIGFSNSALTNEAAVYIEDETRLDKNSKLAFGARLVAYSYKDVTFILPEPRISFNTKIDNEYAIKASYSMMHQSVHQLMSEQNSFFTDRWVPATENIKPQRAQQISLGITKPYDNNFELSVEGYYKWMDNIVELKEGARNSGGLLDNSNWENDLLTGNGTCYGIETFLHKRKGNTNGWIGYTLSWATRNTPGVNKNQTYYFDYDRRHFINMVMQHKIDDDNSISINLVFSTGNVQSVPTGKHLDINGNVVYDYPEKNNFRLPNTFRIDVGYSRKRDSWWAEESGYRLSIYNVLARNNPAYIYIDNSNPTNQPNIQPRVMQRGLLGFIPGITYYTKF
ncbi:MAG: TonB-dependent receptor plug domain-containing protein [Bacteroidota bacterium]|nr:TonB-dependent receptor plug domain-containing protein [Bacteroidota bacterium]